MTLSARPLVLLVLPPPPPAAAKRVAVVQIVVVVDGGRPAATTAKARLLLSAMGSSWTTGLHSRRRFSYNATSCQLRIPLITSLT